MPSFDAPARSSVASSDGSAALAFACDQHGGNAKVSHQTADDRAGEAATVHAAPSISRFSDAMSMTYRKRTSSFLNFL